jgi:hypothetical protein
VFLRGLIRSVFGQNRPNMPKLQSTALKNAYSKILPTFLKNALADQRTSRMLADWQILKISKLVFSGFNKFFCGLAITGHKKKLAMPSSAIHIGPSRCDKILEV